MLHKFEKEYKDPQPLSTRTEGQIHNSPLSLHRPDNEDVVLAKKAAKEMINISGADVIIYARTKNESYDKVWNEDPAPTYHAGRHLKAYFVPQPTAEQLTPFGIDAPNTTSIAFCREEIVELLGERMLMPGDIIEIPYSGSLIRPDRFRITNAADTGNFRYVWLYITCNAETITNDEVLDIQNPLSN
jgi:hypothetical protein